MRIITGLGSLDKASESVMLTDGPVAQPTSGAAAMAELTCTIARRDNLTDCIPEGFESLACLFMNVLYTNVKQLICDLHIVKKTSCRFGIAASVRQPPVSGGRGQSEKRGYQRRFF